MPFLLGHKQDFLNIAMKNFFSELGRVGGKTHSEKQHVVTTKCHNILYVKKETVCGSARNCTKTCKGIHKFLPFYAGIIQLIVTILQVFVP